MAKTDQVNSKTSELVISPRDVLFECPACGKSLVVDEAAEGLIVDCPQCRMKVIVPPKPPAPVPRTSAPPAVEPKAAPQAETPAVADETQPTGEVGDLRARLQAMSNQLRELQTQRVEINNRLAARVNDFNRDLVMMARLETAHQQVLSELSQLIGQLASVAPGGQSTGASATNRTRVNLRA